MYCRTITFTLLAPSIWPLIEAVAKTSQDGGYSRFLMRANNNSGVVIETFEHDGLPAASRGQALQALNEQAMAKIGVSEGDLIKAGCPGAPYCGSNAALDQRLVSSL